MTKPSVILIFALDYQRTMLRRLYMPFDVTSPRVDEIGLISETPELLALQLAHEKVCTIAIYLPSCR